MTLLFGTSSMENHTPTSMNSVLFALRLQTMLAIKRN